MGDYAAHNVSHHAVTFPTFTDTVHNQCETLDAHIEGSLSHSRIFLTQFTKVRETTE